MQFNIITLENIHNFFYVLNKNKKIPYFIIYKHFFSKVHLVKIKKRNCPYIFMISRLRF